MTEQSKCQICGEPVAYPWKYHGYDGNACPAPPLKKVELDPAGNPKLELTVLERQAIDVLNAFTALPEDVLAQVPTQLLMNAHAVLAMASVAKGRCAMTEQEQKAFDQMREALNKCVGALATYTTPGTFGGRVPIDADVVNNAIQSIAAANAVSEQQGEAARLKAFLHKHKSSALPEGACVTCEGEGEIGGQFCGGFQECSDCAGTGKKSAHPQATEPARWKLVPVEPTPEMWKAVNKLDDDMAAGSYDGKGCTIEQAWNCMLAAAPDAHHG